MSAHSRVLALLLVVLGVFLAGCGEKDESTAGKQLKTDNVVLLMDWYPNADHAGIYTGIENGAFRDQGIVLQPKVPSDPSAVIKQVAAGRADLGISYQNEVMNARDAGVKIKAIGAIVNRPLNSLIWLKKSGIKQIKDLKGKKVGTSGAYGSTFLRVMLENAGLKASDVEQVNLGYDQLPHLIAGKVDAIIGVYFNVEGVQLQLRNRPATIIPVDEGGAPSYNELVVIASEKNLKDGGRGAIYRRFLTGLRDGTNAAIADQQLAAQSLMKNYADLKKDRDFLDASLKATLPVLKPTEGKPYGYMDPAIWTTFASYMRDNKLLKQAPNAQAAYTNELLPSGASTKK